MRQLQYRTFRRVIRRRKGMTLTEIMIVVIIMALISAAVGGVVINRLRSAEENTARTDARTIADQVINYVAENPGADCPDMDELVSSGFIDEDRRVKDPWDNDFTIECQGDDITVMSPGRDGQMGSEDDISSDRND